MKKTVVVINSNIELIQALTDVFESENYDVASYQTIDLKQGKIKLQDILRTHTPEAILYDVAIPYKENWNFFLEIKSEIENSCKIIITTTNKKALEEFVGKTSTIELIGKPFDMKQILTPLL